MRRHIDIQKTIELIKRMNSGKTGEYYACEGGQINLYSSCFAVMIAHYLGYLSEFTVDEKNRWAEYINNWQEQSTGLYIGPEIEKDELTSSIHDYEHVTMHLTAHVLPALNLLDSSPQNPLIFAHRFLNKDKLNYWLESRNWGNAWLEGNNLLFVGQFLIYLRDYEGIKEASKSLDLYFDWLDSQVDPETGLWGTNGHCSPFVAMCGGYHQLIVYNYENREIKFKKRLIDTVLSLQHPDGGFAPKGGGGACEDVDAADILVNMYKHVNYRRVDIRIALRRLIKSIIEKQMPDGGFVNKLNRSFIHMGIAKTRSSENVSNMFSTWFRLHAIALISEILTDEEVSDINLQYNNTCSMGWHRTWDKKRHQINISDRALELIRSSTFFMQAYKNRIKTSSKKKDKYFKHSIYKILDILGKYKKNLKQRKINNILSNPTEPQYCDLEKLFVKLQRTYSPPPDYRYDTYSVWHRGFERTKKMLKMIDPLKIPGMSVLEAGCGDGMTGYALNSYGHHVTLVDIEDWRDKRAINLKFIRCNLNSELPISSDTFDMVFSFNTFEHLDNPATAFSELVRVCKKNGYIYLNFNPLYASPWGLHVYRTIHIPYFQFLFSEDFIKQKLQELGIYDLGKKRETLQHLNKWKVNQFVELWQKSNCDIVSLSKETDIAYLELVKKFPRLFTGRGLTSEDINVKGLEVILKK